MNANTDDSIFAYFKIILLFLWFCVKSTTEQRNHSKLKKLHSLPRYFIQLQSFQSK